MEHKELIICNELKKWFERYNIKVWLNQGESSFKTKKSQKKPDIIIYSNILKKYIAIEVKLGNIKKDVYDASKIIDYWKNYTDNNIEYYINNKKVEIYSFCIATINSIEGKLFFNDNKLIDSYEKNDNWSIIQRKYNLEPRYEFNDTKNFLRMLWANWRRLRNKNQAGIGIIVSNILNNKDVQPLLYDLNWEINTWKVRQKWL